MLDGRLRQLFVGQRLDMAKLLGSGPPLSTALTQYDYLADPCPVILKTCSPEVSDTDVCSGGYSLKQTGVALNVLTSVTQEMTIKRIVLCGIADKANDISLVDLEFPTILPSPSLSTPASI